MLQRYVHPSTPKPRHGSRPPPLTPSAIGNKENRPTVPRAPRKPSDGWMKTLGWIDGGVNPPIFFYTEDDIRETLNYYAPDHPFLQEPPSPAIDPELLALSTPTPSGPTAAQDLTTMLATAASSSVPENDSAPIPLETAGYMVSVTIISSVTDKPLSSSRGAKPTTKKLRNSKFDYIDILALERGPFFRAGLKVHDLDDQYSPGVHSGPAFKIHWTGSSGGKAGAVTIDTDRDFKAVVDALSKKNRTTCHVNVEIDLDTMEGFRIRKRPIGQAEDSEADSELLYGTKVPRVESFTEVEQLHGTTILQLKQKWSCERHQGEHGEPGFCYVDTAGNHLGLNNRKLKIWASAI
ncbi:hypothetical protein DXG01_010072, partial [Tephrocybe rancida]